MNYAFLRSIQLIFSSPVADLLLVLLFHPADQPNFIPHISWELYVAVYMQDFMFACSSQFLGTATVLVSHEDAGGLQACGRGGWMDLSLSDEP